MKKDIVKIIGYILMGLFFLMMAVIVYRQCS